MNIKLIHELLTNKNIKTIASDTSIEKDPGSWENYYKLRLKEDKWEKSDGREKILKVFDDEQTGKKMG